MASRTGSLGATCNRENNLGEKLKYNYMLRHSGARQLVDYASYWTY